MSTANIVGLVLVSIPFCFVFCGIVVAMWMDAERRFGPVWASWCVFVVLALMACIISGSILLSL